MGSQGNFGKRGSKVDRFISPFVALILGTVHVIGHDVEKRNIFGEALEIKVLEILVGY